MHRYYHRVKPYGYYPSVCSVEWLSDDRGWARCRTCPGLTEHGGPRPDKQACWCERFNLLTATHYTKLYNCKTCHHDVNYWNFVETPWSYDQILNNAWRQKQQVNESVNNYSTAKFTATQNNTLDNQPLLDSKLYNISSEDVSYNDNRKKSAKNRTLKKNMANGTEDASKQEENWRKMMDILLKAAKNLDEGPKKSMSGSPVPTNDAESELGTDAK